MSGSAEPATVVDEAQVRYCRCMANGIRCYVIEELNADGVCTACAVNHSAATVSKPDVR